MKRALELGDLVEHITWVGDGTDNVRVTERSVCENALVCNQEPSCRLLVKRDRLAEKWPTDPEFRRFAAAIADSVQRALFEGKQLGRNDGPNGDDCCPLGTLPQAASPWPACDDFSEPAPGTEDQRVMFACGYDDDWVEPEDESDPYYLLGLAYRQRFVSAKSGAL